MTGGCSMQEPLELRVLFGYVVCVLGFEVERRELKFRQVHSGGGSGLPNVGSQAAVPGVRGPRHGALTKRAIERGRVMPTYLVRSHCCGAGWMVVVPCIGTQTYVTDKRDIEPTARRLLAQMTGFAPEQIHLDLTAGRVVDKPEERRSGIQSGRVRRLAGPEYALALIVGS